MISSIGDLLTDAEAAGNSGSAAAAAAAAAQASNLPAASTTATTSNLMSTASAASSAPVQTYDPVSSFIMSMPAWVLPVAGLTAFGIILYYNSRKK